jgi:hypothetical protein
MPELHYPNVNENISMPGASTRESEGWPGTV